MRGLDEEKGGEMGLFWWWGGWREKGKRVIARGEKHGWFVVSRRKGGWEWIGLDG